MIILHMEILAFLTAIKAVCSIYKMKKVTYSHHAWIIPTRKFRIFLILSIQQFIETVFLITWFDTKFVGQFRFLWFTQRSHISRSGQSEVRLPIIISEEFDDGMCCKTASKSGANVQRYHQVRCNGMSLVIWGSSLSRKFFCNTSNFQFKNCIQRI